MSEFLDQLATQSGFAKLVGVSPQAIQKNAEKIGLKSTATYREWILKYTEHLRNEAAGRGGDSAGDLTRQRIQESKQKTLQISLDNLSKLGQLVPAQDAFVAFDELGRILPQGLNNVGEQILERLGSKLDVEFDDELVFGPIRDYQRRLASNARELGERFRQAGDSTGAEAASIDSRMVTSAPAAT